MVLIASVSGHCLLVTLSEFTMANNPICKHNTDIIFIRNKLDILQERAVTNIFCLLRHWPISGIMRFIGLSVYEGNKTCYRFIMKIHRQTSIHNVKVDPICRKDIKFE